MCSMSFPTRISPMKPTTTPKTIILKPTSSSFLLSIGQNRKLPTQRCGDWNHIGCLMMASSIIMEATGIRAPHPDR